MAVRDTVRRLTRHERFPTPDLLLLAFALLATTPAFAQSGDVRRGPTEIRDEQLLAQPRLTLPAVSPDTLPARRWSVTVSGLLSNSFSWDQSESGEHPELRRYLIDGEALSGDLTVRRGLTDALEVGVRVPLRSRGGGVLDAAIDWWHELLNLPDGDRPDFERDAYRVEGLTRAEAPFAWPHSGTGLGNVEVEARYRVFEGEGDTSLALVTRAALPTTSGPYGGHGFGGGAQLVLAKRLGERFDLYAGAGATAQDGGPVEDIAFETVRAHGFLAIEWRPWRSVSLVAETNAASRLASDILHYPGTHWMLNVSGRFDLGRRTRLDLGFTENIASQQTTTDVALYAALGLRL
jgi:hypothetical protein